MGRRKKRSALQLALKPETVHAILGTIFVAIGNISEVCVVFCTFIGIAGHAECLVVA